MTRKALPTLGVIGAASGCLLKDKGFGEIHEVFDHFYPGIMTLGIAAMGYKIKPLICSQVPAVERYDSVRIERDGYATVAADALTEFGDTIELNSDPQHINPLALELETVKRMRPDAEVAFVTTELFS